MVEQDYIMRLIKEMVRTLLKLLFHIEPANPATEIFKDAQQKNSLQKLLDMVDNGNINGAENQIYELDADGNKENLKIALLFYNYLNEKSTDFLEKHNFSREEVMQGMQALAKKYGLESFFNTFLS